MAKEKPEDSYLVSKYLKYKLRIAFYVSFLPLVVCVSLVLNYVSPRIGLINLDIMLYILSVTLISAAAFLLIKEVFAHIISITRDVKLIAAGDTSRKIETGRKDEVSDLAEALNELTQRIRSNITELKGYGEKTTEINLQVQKQVFLLSSLLEISSLISQGAKLDNILKLATEKLRILTDSSAAYLLFKDIESETFYIKAVDGINSQHLLQIKIEPEDRIFDRVIKTNKPLILDKENVLPEELSKYFLEKFKLKNTLAQSVYLKERVVGILGIGNNNLEGPFLYRKDDIELLNVFSRQIAIAVENDMLLHRIEKLEIKDALTGLYNEAFIRNCLKEEIKRAIIYQRPCAFILLNIDNFKEFCKNFGALQADASLKRIAFLIRESVTEIDRVARIGNNEFAIVLPEKNKRQAQRIAEDIRKKIEFSFGEEQEINRRLTVSGGTSENPIDGVEVEELIAKARELLTLAKIQGKNRIVGF